MRSAIDQLKRFGLKELLFVGYFAVLSGALMSAFLTDAGVLGLTPRVLWTVVMPLVPIGFVLFGFHAWRKVCPIATAGSFGAKFYRGRRIPAGWRKHGFTIALMVLITTLVVRLIAVNGDGVALAVFMGALVVGAFVLNARYGGRSFCHYACPVGVVERIYTDATGPVISLDGTDSKCAPCTGCAKSCVDIDGGRAYGRSLQTRDRRRVTFAFPGVVFAFYFYYWLRAGDWEAYFDGRWTAAPLDAALVWGPGFFFAPQVPAAVAAAMTVVGLALFSHAVFALLERGLANWIRDPEVLRHRMLALASFTAFNVFYLFAGAPTLRLVPGLSQIVAIAVPCVATVILVRRLLQPSAGVGTRLGLQAGMKKRLQVVR